MLALALCISSVISIVFFVAMESLPFWQKASYVGTIFSKEWFPREELFGFVPSVVGTLLVVLGGLLIGVPLSFLTAIYGVFYSSAKTKMFLQVGLESAAGLPAVIVGLFGLMTLIPWLGAIQTPSYGLLAASSVLALILTPILSTGIMEIFSADTQETSMVGGSLGISKNTLIWKVIFPMKRAALVRAVALAAGRGLGETLAIMMVAGNIVQIPDGLFSSFRTINATIALEMPYAQSVHRSSLFAAGLAIFILVILIRIFVWLAARERRKVAL